MRRFKANEFYEYNLCTKKDWLKIEIYAFGKAVLRVTTMYDIEKQEDIYKQELLTVARWMLQLFAATKTALY